MLNENFTFAILFNDIAWRTDLTMRHTEYFSRKINTDFLSKIFFPSTIDEAMDRCETDYLVIQESGNVITDFAFFDKAYKILELNQDIVLGFLKLEHDYILLDKKCMIINIPLWKQAGKPMFNTQVRQGPRYTTSGFRTNNKLPFEITKAVGDDMYVPNEVSTCGGAIIVTQLCEFGTARSLEGILDTENFLLDTSSAYSEIHSETVYEKTILANNKAKIFLQDHGSYSDLSSVPCELLVCPAEGLRAFTLAEYLKPKNIVIYDTNQKALDLQRMILQSDRPMLYGEIVDQFKLTSGNAQFDIELRDDKFVPIKPLSDTNISYVLVDACSFEMEDLIKSLDSNQSLVMDFSDIFVYPPNYYKRPLFQIEAIFAELYSLLKSRTAPTRIIGLAPGFKEMDSIDLNTSSAQFTFDPTFDPTAVDESGNPITPDLEPIMFTPNISDRVKDEKINGSWLSSVKDVIFREPAQYIKEVIIERFVDVPREVIVERFVDVPREVRTQPEEVQTVVESDVSVVATRLGYSVSILGGNTIYSKMQSFEEFNAIFEYTVSAKKEWSFKVGKIGKDKRIEFTNGLTEDGLIKHLNIETKINPKTTAKYFQ